MVNELLKNGYKVVVIDNNSTGHNFNDETVTIIADITNPQSFDQLKNYQVSILYWVDFKDRIRDPFCSSYFSCRKHNQPSKI